MAETVTPHPEFLRLAYVSLINSALSLKGRGEVRNITPSARTRSCLSKFVIPATRLGVAFVNSRKWNDANGEARKQESSSAASAAQRFL